MSDEQQHFEEDGEKVGGRYEIKEIDEQYAKLKKLRAKEATAKSSGDEARTELVSLIQDKYATEIAENCPDGYVLPSPDKDGEYRNLKVKPGAWSLSDTKVPKKKDNSEE